MCAQETVEYYGTDALGSVRVVFDPAGTVKARTDYLPFGEEGATTASMPVEHFVGQARDGDAGLWDTYATTRMGAGLNRSSAQGKPTAF